MKERVALSALSQALSQEAIAFLRTGYDRARLVAASSETMARVSPSYRPWLAGFSETLYAATPLSPRDQELALVCLLGVRAPGSGFANHVYAALMEGVTIEELEQVLALIGGYHGMALTVQCMLVVNRTLLILKRMAESQRAECGEVLSAIVEHFDNTAL